MKNKILLIGLIAIVANNVYGQTIQNFTNQQCLPSNKINCFAQSADGNMLIGTDLGLVIFDWNNFSTYTTTDGLGGNVINDIFTSGDGKVYVATSGGLSIFNNGIWQNYTSDVLPSFNIKRLAVDAQNRVWLATSNNTFAKFEDGNFAVFEDNYGFSNGVTDIFVDRLQNIWIAVAGGIVKYDTQRFVKYTQADGIPGNFVYDIYQRYNGNLVIGTEAGIAIYNYNSWSTIEGIQSFATNAALSVKEDFNQNLWFGNATGIYKYDGNTTSLVANSSTLTSDVVNKLFISTGNKKRIFCGSSTNGFSVMDFDGNAKTYRTNSTLVAAPVTEIYSDEDDNVWIGTNSGINEVSNLNWKTYTANLTGLNITAFLKNNDTLWIGTDAGLKKMVNGTVTSITNIPITSLCKNETAVYAGTNLGILNIVNSIVTDTIIAENVLDLIYANSKLMAIFGGSVKYYQNGTWQTIATASANSKFLSYSSELLYFSSETSLNSYRYSTSEIVSYSASSFGNMISMTKSGSNILVSTNNNEVLSFDPSTGIFTEISVLNGAINLTSESNGIVWATYNNKVSRICLDCESTSFTYNSETCDGSSNGNLTLSVAAASQYSIDYGDTWQASGSFNNISGGYKHIIAKNAQNKIICDTVYFLEYSNVMNNENITLEQIECNGQKGKLTLADLNSSTFVWENGNTTNVTRENLNAGIYQVTISSGACLRILRNEIIEPASFIVNENHQNIACYGENTGNISLTVTGGIGDYSYLWSNDAVTAELNGLSAGSYTCTISDENLCTNQTTVIITQPESALLMSPVTLNNDCFGDSEGSIQLNISGGTESYNLSWSHDQTINSQDVTSLAAGEYSVTVTDNNNCQITNQFDITSPEQIQITDFDKTDVLCNGNYTGSISVEVSGGTHGYQYFWQNSSVENIPNTSSINNLQAGIYNLTITDANSCSIMQQYEITESPELIANVDVTPISCAGQNDGSLLASAEGGSGTYSQFYWYNEDNNIVSVTQHYTNVAAGTYKLVVRDSYYCSDSVTVVLSQTQPHTFDIQAVDLLCNGSQNGTVTVSIDGGAETGFTFDWDNSESTTNIATGLSAGVYSVTVTDENNCVTILSDTVYEPEMQELDIWDDFYICYGESQLLDPGNFVSYFWSTGALTPTITVQDAGTYQVTVVDNQNCNQYAATTVYVSSVYTGDKLNLATVTETGTVKLYWNKTPNEGTQSYKIYKDSGDGFAYLTSKNFNEPAIYEDVAVNTNNQYYKYKVTTVDSCGSETDEEVYHRTCKLDVVCDGNNVCNLSWSPYEGTFVVYYFILAGSSPENMEVIDSTLFSTYNYVQINPNETGTYYRIKIRRIDGCYPGDGNYYDEAYSNISFCSSLVNIESSSINNLTAFPNPFNDELNISFDLNNANQVSYEIYNYLGQKVVDGNALDLESGKHTITIKPEIESGIYFVKLNIAGNTQILKLIKTE